MLSRRSFTLAGLAVTAASCGLVPELETRLGLTTNDSKLASEAIKEGTLRIDATTDESGFDDLLTLFKRLYPGIALQYRRPPSSRLFADLLQDVAAGRPTGDIVISSAMNLQFKLVNDGFAQRYASPEKPHLPAWAVWKDQAYAITAEPIVFAYNPQRMPAADVPASHEELADLLRRKPDAYRGKIATYDPERSGSGYLYYTQDLQLSRDTLDLAEAVGRTQPKLYVSGTEANEKLARGEVVLAYNMVSSYMLERQSRDPTLGIVFPSDYTLVMSRIAFIPTAARHTAAARLFLDFILSEAGQMQLARRYMQPIRTGIDVSWPTPPAEVLRPIHFGPALLADLDEFRRRRVLREWRRTFEDVG